MSLKRDWATWAAAESMASTAPVTSSCSVSVSYKLAKILFASTRYSGFRFECLTSHAGDSGIMKRKPMTMTAKMIWKAIGKRQAMDPGKKKKPRLRMVAGQPYLALCRLLGGRLTRPRRRSQSREQSGRRTAVRGRRGSSEGKVQTAAKESSRCSENGRKIQRSAYLERTQSCTHHSVANSGNNTSDNELGETKRGGHDCARAISSAVRLRVCKAPDVLAAPIIITIMPSMTVFLRPRRSDRRGKR